MKVRVHIDTAAALRANHDKFGYRIVDVSLESLSPEHREYMAGHTKAVQPNNIPADVYLDNLDIVEPTPEAIRKAIDAALAKERAKADAWLTKTPESCLRGWGTGHQLIENFPDDPRLAQLKEAALALAAEKNEAYRVKEEAEEVAREARLEESRARQAAEAAEKKQAKARLQEWAEAHGSELLKARVAGEFDWERLAQAEYAEQAVAVLHLPYPRVYQDGDCFCDAAYIKGGERTTPTLPEIRALEMACNRIADAGLPITARLCWEQYEDDACGEPVSRTELCLAVTAPDGDEREFYLVITGNEAPAKERTVAVSVFELLELIITGNEAPAKERTVAMSVFELLELVIAADEWMHRSREPVFSMLGKLAGPVTDDEIAAYVSTCDKEAGYTLENQEMIADTLTGWRNEFCNV